MGMHATYVPALILCWVAGLPCLHAGEETLTPAEWNGRRIADLARQLEDNAYGSREKASRELSKAPVSVMPILAQLARETDDPESRQRLHEAARTLFVKWILRRLPEWNKGRGFLGIGWEIGPQEAGIRLTHVFPDTAAARGGLKVDDVILSVNGNRFEKGVKHEDVEPVWRNMLPGDRLNLVVKRAGRAEPLKLAAVVGKKEEGSGFTSGIPTDWEKERNLWTRYLQGRLDIPIEVYLPAANTAKRHRLQSWPTVLQATQAAPNPKS